VERAPRRRMGSRRGAAWRASSGGGGNRLRARREIRSTGGAHSGIGGAVPWPEVPGDGGAPVDTVAALDTLSDATALSTHRSQLDRALEVRRHGSSMAAARSIGARSAQLEEQSYIIGSLWGVAWWPAAQHRGTAQGGEARDAWAAASVAGALVLDIACEQQRSGSARRKSRAGWEQGASGETWFLLDVKAGIRVVVDKAVHMASKTVASVGLWVVEVGGRWCSIVATRGDEATARAFKWWVRLTGGPSPISDFSQDFQTPKI
jgi:hypothetical protein